MEHKIIFLLCTVFCPSLCQIPDYDPNGDFPFPDFNPFEGFEDNFDADGEPEEFNSFGGNFGHEGVTSAVLHSQTQEIQAKLGSEATLPCHVTNPGPVTVSWTFLKNNKQITDGDKVLGNRRHYNLELQYPGEWNLVIKGVRYDDAGEYLCLLQDIPPQMKYVNLVLIAPPRIEKSSLKERYKVMEGEPLQITCQVIGSPTPTVQWYGYHTNPTTSEEERELLSNNSVLYINSLQRSDAGIYSCEASNSHGKDMYEVLIEPKYKPKPATLSTEIVVKYGTDATLKCKFYSSPRAQIEWTKDGEKIRINWKYNIYTYKEEKLQGSELTIRNTDELDTRMYNCTAVNDIGRHVTTFTVLVINTTTTTSTTTTTPTTSTTITNKPTKNKPEESAQSTKPIPIKTDQNISNTAETSSSSPRAGESTSLACRNQDFSTMLFILTVMLSFLQKVS